MLTITSTGFPYDAGQWSSDGAWYLSLSKMPAPTAKSATPFCTFVTSDRNGIITALTVSNRQVPAGQNDGCKYEHCLCNLPGGVVAPLTTTVISSTTTSNCAYTVQQTIDNCPPPPSSTPAPSPTTMATSTTLTASPVPAPTSCAGTSWPSSLPQSIMSSAVAPACSAFAKSGQQVTKHWPGTCSSNYPDNNPGIIYSISPDTTNSFCLANWVSKLLDVNACIIALLTVINGCMSVSKPSCPYFIPAKMEVEKDKRELADSTPGDLSSTSAKHGGWTSTDCVKYSMWPGPLTGASACPNFCPPGSICSS